MTDQYYHSCQEKNDGAKFKKCTLLWFRYKSQGDLT